VGEDSSGRCIPATLASSCVRVLGKASATIDNRTGSVLGGAAAAANVEVEYGVFDWANNGSSISADDVGKLCYAVDDQTVDLSSSGGTRPIAGLIVAFRAKHYGATAVPYVWSNPVVPVFYDTLTDLASTANAKGASLIGIEDAANNFAATNVEGALAEIISDLAATTATNGASRIGVQDAGNFTTATTAEACLAEIYQHLKTASCALPGSLLNWREVDSSGDVGNIAANGGLLASDTTPILRADAAESFEINWAASNSDPIACQWMLPNDFDGTANVTVDMWVLSGTTDAASFTIETSWDGGALVSDALDDASTKSATVHKLSATIAAADIPDAPNFLTMALTPPAHTTNAISLLGVRINYKRKLQTS
jgi:hypothetical protein